MYRNQIKKSNFKTLKNKSFEMKSKGKNVRPMKAHSNHIGTTQIRNMSYNANEEVTIELYDNIDSPKLQIDYVKKEEETEGVAEGFDKCLILPIYIPEKQNYAIHPHVEEIQDMYEWMVLSKEMKLSDPNEKGKNEFIYPLNIMNETRTIIQEQTQEGWRYNMNIIPNSMYDEENKYIGEVYEKDGKKYPVVWLGYYKKKEEEGKEVYESYFLKTYLKKYDIRHLYLSNGRVNQKGEFTKKEIEGEGPEGEIEDTLEDVDSEIEIRDNTCIGLRWRSYTTLPEIPGYQCYLEPEEGESQEIMIRPILNTGVTEVEIHGMNNMKGLSKEVKYKITEEDLNNEEEVEIYGEEYVEDEERGRVMKKPLLSFIYSWKEEDLKDKEKKILKEEISRKICKKIKRVSGYEIKGCIKVYQTEEENSEVAQLRYLNDIEISNSELKDNEEKEYLWLYNVNIMNSKNEMKYYKSYTDKGEEIVGESEEEESEEPKKRRNPTKVVIIKKEKNDDEEVKDMESRGPWLDIKNYDDLYTWLMVNHWVYLNTDQNNGVYNGEGRLQAKRYYKCKINGVETHCCVYEVRMVTEKKNSQNEYIVNHILYHPHDESGNLARFEDIAYSGTTNTDEFNGIWLHENTLKVVIPVQVIKEDNNEKLIEGYYKPILCVYNDNLNEPADYEINIHNVGDNAVYSKFYCIYYGIVGKEGTQGLEYIYNKVNNMNVISNKDKIQVEISNNTGNQDSRTVMADEKEGKGYIDYLIKYMKKSPIN